MAIQSYQDLLDEETRAQRRKVHPLSLLLIFMAAFIALQWAWGQARGTVVERLIIDQATVRPAAFLVNLISPSTSAYADGSRLKAPGGGINILNGCEGTEVLFLLYAALLAAPFAWRARLLGTVAATLFVYVLNQVRIIALFFAYRSDVALFDALHGMLAPLLLIACSLLFFLYWLQRYAPLEARAAA
ncbi:MAG: archaeosortase/exosortase family protein [Hydrogenophilales bacterium]|nr:archaeosortase/exosortase family protein [Hydrogenophilales bacterium]